MPEEMKAVIAAVARLRPLCGGLLLSVILLLAPAMAAKIPPAAIARVQEFVRGEFDGAEDMRSRFAVAPARATQRTASGEDPDALEGQVFSLVGDPLVVVSAYTPGEAERDGTAVIVPVDFHLIATTQGEGVAARRFVRAAATTERVRYRVVQQGSEWLLQDPPLPHVSTTALLQSYKSQVDYAKEKLLPLAQTSRAQRDTFAAMEQAMNALQALAGTNP